MLKFKEFVDEHDKKATVKATEFIEAQKVEVKSFTSFADNLAKTHLIISFEEAPVAKKPAARKTTKSTATK